MEKNNGMRSSKREESERSVATNPPRILLAEDDREMRALLVRALRKAGYDVTECVDGFYLLNHLASFLLPGKPEDVVDLIITDIRMPGFTGLEVLKVMYQYENCPPMILITAFGDEEIHAEAIRLGAAAMFDKPFEIGDLLANIHEILSLSRDDKETRKWEKNVK